MDHECATELDDDLPALVTPRLRILTMPASGFEHDSRVSRFSLSAHSVGAVRESARIPLINRIYLRAMETEVMRATFNCREYGPDPVPDEVFHRAIESARFAPQGGNRQPVRFLIVRNEEKKRRLGDRYLEEWKGPY